MYHISLLTVYNLYLRNKGLTQYYILMENLKYSNDYSTFIENERMIVYNFLGFVDVISSDPILFEFDLQQNPRNPWLFKDPQFSGKNACNCLLFRSHRNFRFSFELLDRVFLKYMCSQAKFRSSLSSIDQ